MSGYPPPPPVYGSPQPYPQDGSQPYPQDGSPYSAYGTTAPQPYPPYGSPYSAYGPGAPPPTHLVWAILTTLLCIMPLGVASIVYSCQVNSKWAAGDFAGAQQASAKARNFAIWSGAAGAALFVVLFAFGFMGALAEGV